MNLEAALKIEGWMGPFELEWLAETASKSRRICEVGAWQGRSTVAMADNTEGFVVAVDTWLGSKEHQDMLRFKGHDWLYREFEKNIADRRVYPLRGRSTDMAKMCSALQLSFHFIFLDASHDYESVKADILAWRPLLAEGGVFAGHDILGDWPGVKKAVDELVKDYFIAPNTSIWVAK